ncbi:hypothetical protein Micbo1qcDRAFT_166995 [Microdochium bolleyi]|uniref:C2H2-type domain-containing protein n=1 Tax=Microdochium bolleyi TaxID=196109 RepID=A0A136ITT6_9PEZI|nr:hypothetical protein Micbo1qcDRAFT_166995 [Microdochium bolleyi]
MLHKGHPFNQQLPGLVDAAVRQYTAWRSHKECTQPSTTGKRRRGTDGENSGRAGGVSSRRGLGKDSQRDGDDDEEEGDESKSRKRARGPSSGDQPELDDNNATLACPYYKYNKLRHDRCLYLQLRRIKDVKQHLRRAHNQPHFCPICGVAFADSRDDLNEHLIARTCERREFQVPEGVTDSHRAKFTQRVARTLSLSEQWFTVWDILFPGQPRPESPFVEGPVAEVSAEVILWWNRHGRSVVSDHIEANGGAEEFERRVRNYERDLATLFVTVGRDLLGRVVDRMRAGHESGDAATRDSPVASEKHATAETQTALGGSSTSAEAPSSSHVSRDSLDEEREFGKALDRAFAPVAAVAAIAGHDECAVPWQNGQRSSSPVSLLERKANVAAEAEPGFEFSAGALPMWWEMPGFEMDSFT